MVMIVIQVPVDQIQHKQYLSVQIKLTFFPSWKEKKSFLSFLFINLKLIIKTSLSENDNPCSLFQALGVMVLTFGLWLLFDRNNLFGVLCEYI